MEHFRRISDPGDLCGIGCWKKLSQKDREVLPGLFRPGRTSSEEQGVSYVWAVSEGDRQSFVLWVSISSEEGSFGGVCLPDGFAPERDLSEDLSEEIFMRLDRLEIEYHEKILFLSEDEGQEAFWNEVGLSESGCLCWMRSNDSLTALDPERRITGTSKQLTLQKVDLFDPVFRRTLSESFEEPEELYSEQLEEMEEQERAKTEALLILSEEKVAGQALIVPYEDGYQLTYFGILPDRRRRGLGTEAFSLIRKVYRPLYLSVEEESEAYHLYERCGMEPYRYLISFLIEREPKNY